MELKWKGKYSKNKKPSSEPSKPSDRSWIPKPLKVKCFQCKKLFEIKYVVASKGYGRKNNWEYWTNLKANNPNFWEDKKTRQKDKQICNSCLLALYHDKDRFWEVVKDRKKKKKLGVYIYTGIIE